MKREGSNWEGGYPNDPKNSNFNAKNREKHSELVINVLTISIVVTKHVCVVTKVMVVVLPNIDWNHVMPMSWPKIHFWYPYNVGNIYSIYLKTLRYDRGYDSTLFLHHRGKVKTIGSLGACYWIFQEQVLALWNNVILVMIAVIVMVML